MKRVTSIAGHIAFSLPDDWVQELDDDLMMFYHPRDHSGTLRLTVMTGEDRGNARDPRNIVRSSAEDHRQEIGLLPNGMWAMKWDSEPVEDGTVLFMQSWGLVHAEDRKLVLATFTFTLEKSRREDPSNVADMEMVDQAIQSCELIMSPPVPEAGKRKLFGLFGKGKK